jgi:hypothetical protein
MSQRLLWDRKDDRGRKVPAGRYRVRVAAGMTPEFDRNIGWGPMAGLSRIQALAAGPRGELYLATGGRILAVDASGKELKYLRQVYPPGSRARDLSALEPIAMADGGRVFKNGFPGLRGSNMAVTRDGRILIAGGRGGPRKIIEIGSDGSIAKDPFSRVLHPKQGVGHLKIGVSPDGKWVYCAGHQWGHADAAVGVRAARQHMVTRMRLDRPGPGAVFVGDHENSGRSAMRVRAPRAVTVDKAGSVYVADFGNNRVGVWSSDGLLLREMSVPAPQEVYVHPGTGAVYVLSGPEHTHRRWEGRYFWKRAALFKFSAEGKKIAELELPPAFIQKKRDYPQGKPKFRLTGALDCSGKRPRVFIGLSDPIRNWSRYLLLRVEDLGSAFAKPVSVMAKAGDALLGIRYVAVDRTRDELYVRDSGWGAMWRFDGATGKGTRLDLRVPKGLDRAGKSVRLGEMHVGPDGLVYLTCYHSSHKNNSILRFTRDGEFAPFKATATGAIRRQHLLRGSSAQGCRGLGVGHDGRVYLLYYDLERKQLPPSSWDRNWLKTVALDVYDADGRLLRKRLVAHLREGAGGVRADRAGNVYIADNVKPLGYAYPRELAAKLPDPLKRTYVHRWGNGGGGDRLLYNYGCVFKFPPTGAREEGIDGKSGGRAPRPAGNLWRPVPEVQWFPWWGTRRVRLRGATWQYLGISPMPAQVWQFGAWCVCGGGRFDLDEHARVAVPDALASRVKVLDAAGNALAVFGGYGNMDDRGPELRFGYPGWVAASSRAIYVGDAQNCRVVRVRLDYRAEGTAAFELK